MFRTTNFAEKIIRQCALLIGIALGLVGTPSTVHAQGYSVLYNFCSQQDCADGAGPSGPLLLDGQGNLYGTTASGGSGSGGVVFKISE